jgi:predicted methyltransferase MtxX (methanogen marker protein 4)
MEVRAKFSRRKKKSDPFLRVKVAFAIKTFVQVSRRAFLENSRTRVVMGEDYVPSVMQDVDRMENREKAIAVVYLKDMDSYQEFRTIQADAYLRGSSLGETVLDHLADQVTIQLLKRAEKTTA